MNHSHRIYGMFSSVSSRLGHFKSSSPQKTASAPAVTTCWLSASRPGGKRWLLDETGSLLFIVFPSRPLLRAWPGGDGEGAYGQRVCVPAPLATDFEPIEAWLEELLLSLALAGPAGDLKNALLRRRLGCYVADCA